MITRTRWALDHAHSEISFTIMHLMIARIKGTFKKFSANIQTAGNDFATATVFLTVEMDSIATGNSERDTHLKSGDFFNVQQYKQMTFLSTNVGTADALGNHLFWGELTIKQITRTVRLNAMFGGVALDDKGNERAGFHITGTINRNDWNLSWNENLQVGGLLLGEDISISCEVELVKTGEQELELPAMNQHIINAFL